MKTYKHLYENMLNPEYIKQCIMYASKGKRHRRLVQSIIQNPQPVINKTMQETENKTWYPPYHNKSKLREGSHKKERLIEKPVFNNEQVIHHMLIGQLKPILIKKFYELSCGSIPGRGPLMIVNKIVNWRNNYHNKIFYVAELDIKKFYQHVNTEKLKQQLSSLIKDDNYLNILFRVIDNSSPGLPLGYYTSPWLGNFYLTPLDMYIVHTLKPDHYARYMDNLFILHNDKKVLHDIVNKIKEFCNIELDLQIKKDWQVFQFEHNGTGRAINCLGYVIHENRVTLRKSLLKRIRAKANRMYQKGKISLFDARAMISYSSWLKNSNTYDYYSKWIKPNISFRYCKDLVSKKSERSDNNDKLGIST